MNTFNLEITYKDVCNVTYDCTPYYHRLTVELFDGSIIKATEHIKLFNDGKSVYAIGRNDDQEKYNALNKVANDYLKYIGAIRIGNISSEGGSIWN